MPGLVPGIHAFFARLNKTWMAGTSPAMTNDEVVFKKRPAQWTGLFSSNSISVD
jgi:hypothetical protein